MKKIMKGFIGCLAIFAVFAMSVMMDAPEVEALYPNLTYEFESGIPSRTIYTYTYASSVPEITFSVNGDSFKLSIDSAKIISAYCDENGTLWMQSSNYRDTGFEIYWTNYELEGANMTPHYFNNGSIHIAVGNWIDSYINVITGEVFPLPTFDDLRNYLENGTPVPGSKPKPIIEPDSDSATDSGSTTDSDSKTVADTQPTSQETPPTSVSNSTSQGTSSTQKTATIKKITTSKNTIKLINSNNKVVDKVTFNKKKSTLSYNGKKIKKVKGVWFTKKGNLVYLKTNSKAYYLSGKKSKLIKSKVSRVKTSSKFAASLKLKNGKTYKLK